MSRVTMQLRSDFHRLGDSLMKIKLFRFVGNGLLAFVNVSRDFYLARMILLGDHPVVSPHRNHQAPTEGI
ncbi:MAG: hypothetical protein ACRC8Y_20550 [Chroococcales cyanobacterium]